MLTLTYDNKSLWGTLLEVCIGEIAFLVLLLLYYVLMVCHLTQEFALMNDTKRTTTCVAATPVEVFVIGKSVSYVTFNLSTPFLHRDYSFHINVIVLQDLTMICCTL